MEAEKVIKETKVKIESDYPALAKLINGWPDHYGSEKRAIWDMVWLAFDFGKAYRALGFKIFPQHFGGAL